MKELHGQSLSTTIAESDRIASGIPGQVAAKNILFSNFWAQLKSIFGVNNWSAREYKSSPCIVVYNKAQYILDESVAPLPFNSTDLTTELTDGIWIPLGSSITLASHVSLTDINGDATYQHINTTVFKTTPIDADSVAIWDSVALKMVLTPFTNLKIFLSDLFATKIELDSTITTYPTISVGVAKIDLSKNRSYTDITAGQNFEIQIDQLAKKDQKTATWRIFPNGFTVTVSTAINNMGSVLTLDSTKQNTLLFGTAGGFDMYRILSSATYVDPKLAAPVVSLTGVTVDSLTFGWSDIGTNTDTEVRISADGVTYGSWISIGLNAVTYSITGLTVGITRYLQARFIGNGTTIITSDPSTAVSGTTAANLSPTASSVLLTSTPTDWQVGNSLGGSYIYADTESNAQDTTATGTMYNIKSYDSIALANADTNNTSGVLAYSGFTGGSPFAKDTIGAAYVGKYLKLWIQPVAVGGTTTGIWTASSNLSNIIIALPFYLNTSNVTIGANNKLTSTAPEGRSVLAASIPSSTDGGIKWQITDSNSTSQTVGFNYTNTLDSFSTFKQGVYYINSATGIFRITNGTSVKIDGITITIGTWIRLVRRSGIIYIETSPDNSVWTTIYTFPTADTSLMYMHANPYSLNKNIDMITVV